MPVKQLNYNILSYFVQFIHHVSHLIFRDFSKVKKFNILNEVGLFGKRKNYVTQ